MVSTTPASEEDAARSYLLAAIRQRAAGPAARGGGSAAAAAPAPAAPAFARTTILDSLATKTRLIRFEQTVNKIPVFGSAALVELNSDRQLVALSAKIADLETPPDGKTISVADAWNALRRSARFARDVAAPSSAPQRFFRDPKDGWRLAYFFQSVPAAPANAKGESSVPPGDGPPSYRDSHPLYNFLVDAVDGRILLAYSARTQLRAAPPPPPVKSTGVDDDAQTRTFYSLLKGTEYVLEDPLRHIRTFDRELRTVGDARPPKLPSNKSATFKPGFEHVVSAHANATKVWDFYNDVLKRKGIVDDQSYLVSFVDCIADGTAGPDWKNAQWDGQKMLYGQVRDGSGKLRTLARFVDVAGHELTHGVVSHTSALEYRDQSGALDESFADIMGMFIRNWDATQPATTAAAFNWEIGSGLGDRGLPLRDLSNPRRTGLPDHMKAFVNTTDDSGGVHTNSSIHNKTAFVLLTAVDANKQPVIPWHEVAFLYYETLIRLDPEATFHDARAQMLSFATGFYAGDARKSAKLNAIAKAYDAVGIK